MEQESVLCGLFEAQARTEVGVERVEVAGLRTKGGKREWWWWVTEAQQAR